VNIALDHDAIDHLLDDDDFLNALTATVTQILQDEYSLDVATLRACVGHIDDASLIELAAFKAGVLFARAVAQQPGGVR
jgi:hypothetical protein